jgi:hypothetical protein
MSNGDLIIGMVGCLTTLHVLIRLLSGSMVFAAMALGVRLDHCGRPSWNYVDELQEPILFRKKLN